MLALFAALAPIHVVTRKITGRSAWPRRFLAAAGWIIGVRVRLEGAPIAPHSLLVANHTSWLDIVVLGGWIGSAFVSKDELGHSLVHWLADQNATVYVRRSHRKGARDQATAIGAALEGAKPLVLFPEGTTGPGTHLLPFRSTLLEAASYASRDVAVRPVAVDYGDAAAEVGWWGEPGKDNVSRILRRRGTLPVTVHLMPALDRGAGRKRLSAEARNAIAARLGLTLPGHSPIGVEE